MNPQNLNEVKAALAESQAREAALWKALNYLHANQPKPAAWRENLQKAIVEAGAALVSPSDAAAKLLERVAMADGALEGWQQVAAQMEAARDRLQENLKSTAGQADSWRKDRDEARAALRESQAREVALALVLRRTVAILRAHGSRYPGSLHAEGMECDCGFCEARVALASPSDAAAKLLERLTNAEAKAAVIGGEWCAENRAAGRDACGSCSWCCKQARDARDRWLGHVRAIVKWARPIPEGDAAPLDAARRDLAQHDAGRGE